MGYEPRSFLEDPASHHQPTSIPSPQGETDSITGRGVAADGLIHASVGMDGRVTGLVIDPSLFQRPDPTRFTAEVTAAVNGAFDDLDQHMREHGGVFGSLTDDLDAITAGFERALGDVKDDIARAHQRLSRE